MKKSTVFVLSIMFVTIGFVLLGLGVGLFCGKIIDGVLIGTGVGCTLAGLICIKSYNRLLSLDKDNI